MMVRSSARSIASVLDKVTWRVRGVVESDSTRPFKFGLRDMFQRREVARRQQWATELLASEQPTVSVDRTLGYLANPIEGLDTTALCDLGNELAEKAVSLGTSTKGFHINQLLPADRQESLLSIALDRELLLMVTKYLGMVPVLIDMDYFCSLPIPPEKPYSSSQLYHCDDTSISMLKLFVYCDDVTEHDGPLQAISATESRRVRDQVNYRYGGSGYRVGDAVMDSLVPPEGQHSFVGKRGTSFLVDTAQCFHRGSRIRAETGRRMVGYFQFGPPNTTQLPLQLRRGAPFAHLARSRTDRLERAVLGVPVAE